MEHCVFFTNTYHTGIHSTYTAQTYTAWIYTCKYTVQGTHGRAQGQETQLNAHIMFLNRMESISINTCCIINMKTILTPITLCFCDLSKIIFSLSLCIFLLLSLFLCRCFIPNLYTALCTAAFIPLSCVVGVLVVFIHAYHVTQQWKAYDDVYRGRTNSSGVCTLSLNDIYKIPLPLGGTVV